MESILGSILTAADKDDPFKAAMFGNLKEDYVEGAKWLQRAAQQGNGDAQLQLGELHRNGRGVVQDFVEAFLWLNVAATSTNTIPTDNLTEAGKNVFEAIGSTADRARRARSDLAEKMTAQQIAEGQRRAAAFMPRKESLPAQERSGGADISSMGTGFFISEDGCFLTNFHVVEDAKRIGIKTKGRTFPATILKADAANDVAVLKVSGDFRLVPIAASRSVKLGDSVFTIGFPNAQIQGLEPKLTKGEINSLAGIRDDARYFQISVAVQPGNSGGPLVDASGNVVGIVTLRLDDLKTLKLTGSLPQNVNYAVKSSFILAFLESIPELAGKLKAPHPASARKFEDVVKEAQDAVALVLVY